MTQEEIRTKVAALRDKEKMTPKEKEELESYQAQCQHPTWADRSALIGKFKECADCTIRNFLID